MHSSIHPSIHASMHRCIRQYLSPPKGQIHSGSSSTATCDSDTGNASAAHGNAPTSVAGSAIAKLNSVVGSLSCFDRYEQLACLHTASVATFVVPCSLAAFHCSLE